MKIRTILTGLVTGMALLAVPVFTSSCHRGGKAEDGNAENADSVKVWTKIDPTELEMAPIGKISSDWMALAMGSKKSYNSMTISWGTIGELWNKPVFIVFVSSDRASKKLMDANNYFTVSSFPQEREYREALEYIGSHSVREEADKTAKAGLQVEFTDLGNPMFKDAEITIECKKIYSDEFTKEKLPKEVRDKIYSTVGMHTMYIGEIVNVMVKR